MIEKIILDKLAAELAPVPVLMETPPDPPAKYVLLEKTGSSCTDHLWRATIAVQSYGASLLEAATLNHTVKGKILSLLELDTITRAEVETDYNFTDTQSKKYRYQAVVSVTYYEEAIE